jgi:hypothetical protein
MLVRVIDSIPLLINNDQLGVGILRQACYESRQQPLWHRSCTFAVPLV